MQPTNEQQRAIDFMTMFCEDKSPGMMLLTGYAGTGKTFTITKLVESLSHKYRVAMTAPTNKAVKVLERNCTHKTTSVVYKTIHSLLKLKPVVTDDGQMIFKDDTFEKSDIDKVDILIVDETSMLNDELYWIIHEKVVTSTRRFKVIFIADPCQIPPVRVKGSLQSFDALPLMKTHQQTYGIDVVSLTTIMRQAEGSPILDAAHNVRRQIGSFDGNFNLTPSSSAWTIPRFDDGSHDKKFIRDLMELWFISPQFQDDDDWAKIIAWTNRAVDGYNKAIRQMLYGDEITSIVAGERIIVSNIYKSATGAELTNSDELRILSASVEENNKIIKGEVIKYYACLAQSSSGIKSVVQILHEDSKVAYSRMLLKLFDMAKKRKQSSFWSLYFNYRDYFLQYNYGYAITAHRAQGSTYSNVFVDSKNIMLNRGNAIERDRILYTAITRASQKLAIL